MNRRGFIQILSAAGALFTIKPTAFADGTVTTPQNLTSTTWKIASVYEVTGAHITDPAGISITIYYFADTLERVKTEVVQLTVAEVTSFLTMTNSAIAGESGSQIKRRRMRVSKWLIDNNKITNVTPEA